MSNAEYCSMIANLPDKSRSVKVEFFFNNDAVSARLLILAPGIDDVSNKYRVISCCTSQL